MLRKRTDNRVVAQFDDFPATDFGQSIAKYLALEPKQELQVR
jgi:hypothetical protein